MGLPSWNNGLYELGDGSKDVVVGKRGVINSGGVHANATSTGKPSLVGDWSSGTSGAGGGALTLTSGISGLPVEYGTADIGGSGGGFTGSGNATYGTDGIVVVRSPKEAKQPWQPPPGYSGAATIASHSGAIYQSNMIIDGKTYDLYTFTDATSDTLSLTVAPGGSGFVELLVVGGGGGGGSDRGIVNGGGGGCVRWGMFGVDAGVTYPVTVGEGGAVGTYDKRSAGTSAFGEILKSGGGRGGEARYTTGGWANAGHGGGGQNGGAELNTVSGNHPGGGAGGVVYGSNEWDGLPLYITGQEQIYGRGGYLNMPAPVANRGDAGFGGVAGSTGVVVVRVAVG